MIFKDYYNLLGLETTRVSIDEIKSAYRIAAKKYHPDLNIGDDKAEEKIKDINEAYRILSVPSTKRKYDRTWNSHNIKMKQKDLKGKESIFQIFLGSVDNNFEKTQTLSSIRGEDVETEIKIPLEEAYFGTEKKIALKDVTGKSKVFTINIPKGIKDGEKIRLIGQGKNGRNGGKNGDLYIKIDIQNNKKFKLDGVDLYTDLLITPSEASLGARVTLSTIDSETKIYIPKGIQSGERLKIPNKGYYNEQGKRGDLVAEVKIIVPRELTKEEEELYKKLLEVGMQKTSYVYNHRRGVS